MAAFRPNFLVAFYVAIILGATAVFPSIAAAAQKNAISGRYYCGCFIGETVVTGTCSTQSTGGCGKNTGDTCTATCKMVTFTTGATGSGGIPNKGSSSTLGATIKPKAVK